MQSKALFLDRDGVVNEDSGYVHRAEQCLFVDGIFELVRTANTAGYIVAVVTNQAGIARGLYSEAQFHAFMRWMQEEFLLKGARLDHIYHCPHHPEAGLGKLRQICHCRKPEPGLLERARAELSLNMNDSILVGDKESDIEAGHRAGVGRTFLLAEHGTTSLRTVQQAL
jgi:D-glycero-D-manno-heptose 1,7-bisphosphate phosphatase